LQAEAIWRRFAGLRSIGDFPLTSVDVDATLLSIQDGEWQRGRLMTLGIPLKVPSVELEFFIGRIVHGRMEPQGAAGSRKEKKRDRLPEVRSFPELLAVFGIHGGTRARRFKHNRILLTTPRMKRWLTRLRGSFGVSLETP